VRGEEVYGTWKQGGRKGPVQVRGGGTKRGRVGCVKRGRSLDGCGTGNG